MSVLKRRPSADLAGFSPLHYACASKNLVQVLTLLEQGVDINSRDVYGETALHLATQNNSTDIAEALIHRKASVDILNDTRNSPIHVAAQHNFDSLVQMLLKAGADPCFKNIKGQLPSDLCKHDDIKKTLQAAERSNAHSPSHLHSEDDFAHLTLACVRSDTKGVEELLRTKPSLLKTKSVYGDTILHLVCETGNTKMVRLLLDLKADPSVVNARGMTGFQEAERAGFHNILEELECPCFEAAKEYDSEPGLAYSDLQYACVRNDSSAVKDIFSTNKFDDINAPNVYGDTALHYAARSASIGIVNMLLYHKASPNLKSVSSGDTPLIFAVRRGNREIVERLISAGADVEVRNKKGQSSSELLKEKGMIVGKGDDEKSSFTPLMYACVKGDIMKVKELITNGKSTVHDVDVYGNSGLSYACMGKSVEVVKLLIGSKSDVNLMNSVGDTPLHMAVTSGHTAATFGIVELLISCGGDKTIKNHNHKTVKELCKNNTLMTLFE
jgi:ankyrin repeat protein